MAIDFSKAFDTVPHAQLISHIATTPLHANITRWLICYIRGRSARCSYNSCISSPRPVHAGVPQGSVISPVLFNSYVSDFPQSAPLITSYADDFTAAAGAVRIADASAVLSSHSSDVAAWARRKGLSVSIPKSHTTLFTSDTHQSQTDPHVSWEGSNLPLCRTPKILGVTFDPHFTFSPHIAAICQRARPRLNILKSLAGTSWGQQKETLLVTFKALIKSLITYAAPVWFPNASPSAISKLQTIQNSALRIATGSLQMASASHLHSEAEVLPVAEHLSLLCSQYLASALRPHHPSYPIVTQTSGPRPMKHTLQTRFLPSVSHLLEEGSLPPDSYSTALGTLHSSAVSSYLASAAPNKVLLTPAPSVSSSELSLPRAARSALSQLRSGYSSRLNSYLARIGAAHSPLCPECGVMDHTTHHLFSCPSHPTSLTPLDLWSNPGPTAAFLSSLPSFSDILGVDPPLPPPPPEPPPLRGRR
jgi:hypothetical protein